MAFRPWNRLEWHSVSLRVQLDSPLCYDGFGARKGVKQES